MRKIYPFTLRGTDTAIQGIRAYLSDNPDPRVKVEAKYNPSRRHRLWGKIVTDDPDAALAVWTEIDRTRGVLYRSIRGLHRRVRATS